jgi:hypothetical protein
MQARVPETHKGSTRMVHIVVLVFRIYFFVRLNFASR